MKLGDANYDSTVEQKRTELRGHKVTQLTESECKQEIEAITGIIEPIPVGGSIWPGLDEIANALKHTVPKKMGRPKGSRNKPKEIK